MSDLTPRTEAVLAEFDRLAAMYGWHWPYERESTWSEVRRAIVALAPNPEPIPDAPSLREAAAAIQDNAVIPDEYEDYYLVRRDDYAALGNALRPILALDPEAEAEPNPEYDGPDNTAGGHEHWE